VHAPARSGPAGLRRSARLLRAFRTEQTDPAGFYRLVAEDAVELLQPHVDLPGRVVVDVGAGPGYYAEAFRSAGAHYLPVDASSDELHLHGADPVGAGSVLGLAEQLPLRTGSVDVVFSSNALEHVSRPWRVWAEMARSCRPGGLVVMSFTSWWSPWGGHETSPWHYAGGDYAARRYERTHGHPPKNRYGSSLFAVSVADAMRWVRTRGDLTVLEARPRYLPGWAAGVVRVPGVREVLTWNLWVVARRR
jgi:SAM-dependent methyltransferase